MDKRYQVFVSSTYADLKEERQEIMHALLELDCIPAGMELFPAADEDQWTLIKRVIDECDYYIIVLAGRYGSCDSTGMGYTEKEYRYAIEKGKPTIAFLHKEPGDIATSKTEKTDEGKKKLKEFRNLLEQKMCKYWSTPDDLGGAVSRSLIKLRKDKPAVGWVRADQIPEEATLQENLRLRMHVDELEAKLQQLGTQPPPGTEDLAQGEEEFKVVFDFTVFRQGEYGSDQTYGWSYPLTWNDIFNRVAPLMIDEAEEDVMVEALEALIEISIEDVFTWRFPEKNFKEIEIANDNFQTIKVQLLGLGLITKGDRPRARSDLRTFWKLTPYGESVMTKLRAIKRKSTKKPAKKKSTKKPAKKKPTKK